MKSIMRQLAKLFGNKLSYSGAEVKEGELYHVVERKSLARLWNDEIMGRSQCMMQDYLSSPNKHWRFKILYYNHVLPNQ